MKQLKENEGIERSLLLAMAVIAGLTVANCYYNQPLLEMIRHDIGVSQHEANLITVVTQTGYALGLCFLIPMGDLYSRRRIIVVNMTVAAMMAIVIAVAHKVWLIWGMVGLARNVLHLCCRDGAVHDSYSQDDATDKEQLCGHIRGTDDQRV